MAYEGYKDKEKRKRYHDEYMRTYRKTHKRKWNAPDYKVRLRLKAMIALGGPKCISCGCAELQILEINHINGGGNQESRQRASHFQFYRQICKDPEAKAKYNVLCRPCNAVHYVRDILGIKGHKICFNADVAQ